MGFIHSLRVGETVRVVSELEGEDYYVLKATHMLLLMLRPLPNGALPKVVRSVAQGV